MFFGVRIFFKNNVFYENILKNRVVGKEIIRIRLFPKLFSKIGVFFEIEGSRVRGTRLQNEIERSRVPRTRLPKCTCQHI